MMNKSQIFKQFASYERNFTVAQQAEAKIFKQLNLPTFSQRGQWRLAWGKLHVISLLGALEWERERNGRGRLESIKIDAIN